MAVLKIEDELKKEIVRIDELFAKESDGAIYIEEKAKTELMAISNRLTKRMKQIKYDDSIMRGGDCTLQEVAESMGITRERVRQIEQAAIKKIKHPKLGGVLKRYLDQ